MSYLRSSEMELKKFSLTRLMCSVAFCCAESAENGRLIEVQCCKMVDGVMRLYRDEQAMADDDPVPWPCPPRHEFIRHRKMILDMVYNGPL